MKYLQEHDIKARVYFPPDPRYANKRYAVAVWKSFMIDKLGVTMFYEDDTLQAAIIQEANPDCEVVVV
jgi:hypothetical protein